MTKCRSDRICFVIPGYPPVSRIQHPSCLIWYLASGIGHLVIGCRLTFLSFGGHSIVLSLSLVPQSNPKSRKSAIHLPAAGKIQSQFLSAVLFFAAYNKKNTAKDLDLPNNAIIFNNNCFWSGFDHATSLLKFRRYMLRYPRAWQCFCFYSVDQPKIKAKRFD